MFNGFSAIEQLLKMADRYMPQFHKMINDAHDEFDAMRKAAQHGVQADVSRRCPACNALLEETSVYCDNCGTDTPRR